MSQIDWNEVREFYLSCRSYKLTAERFGLNVKTLNTRAYREKWSSDTSNEVRNEVCEVSNEVPHTSNRVQNEVREVSNEVPHTSNKVQNEVCEVSNEVSHTSNCNVEVLLPMLPNLAAHVIEVGNPWEARVIPHEKIPSKFTFTIAWFLRYSTQGS